MKKTIVEYVDDRDRPLIIVKDGRIAVSRYMDLSHEQKAEIVEIYSLLKDGEEDRIWKFLNFDEEDDEFCS
tara:strand:+ start:1948 stop:2160 length:213 start_codon:yes stop_codon:yes gene_type:complete